MTATMLLATMLATAPAPPNDAAPNDYGLGQNWLCRPDRRDACSTPSLDITNIAPDGSFTIRKIARATDPKADCFYVYPTLSNDPGGNSDMIANDEERRVVEAQFARFGTQCRTFAPLYRQSTLTWLRSNMTGKPIPVDMELRYADVRDAWRHYLASDNGGRPFVLVGHSQGSGLLKRLIAEEIEGKPAAAQMLSAMLAGHNVAVATGTDVGGDFKSTPVCRSASQTGCVIAWASFRASAPPPDNSRYGRPPAPGREVVCANPAALGGGAVPLHAIFPATSAAADITGNQPRWTSGGKPVLTPGIALPGLYSGGCATVNGANVLSVRLASDPADGRIDDPGGDLRFGPVTAKDWGLHLIDVNLVMQDMVDLIPQQLAAWQAAQ
jgi:Protein of unknown function (DUF3089)